MTIHLNINDINDINNINKKLNRDKQTIFSTIIIIILFLFIITLNKSLKINILLLIILNTLIVLYNIKSIDNHYPKIIKSIKNDNYEVILIDNILSDDECDELIKYSNTQKFITSETSGEYGNITSDYRKSEQIWITDNENKIADKISNITELLIGLPRSNFESLQLVKYDVSGYFKEHYDAEINKTKKSNIKDRAHTLIVYLNNVEEGGGTEMLKLNLKIQPKKGMGLYFKTLDESGNLLDKSYHQGLPIIRGEKYIINKWVHLNKFKSDQEVD